jgi:hypothetical protein
MPTVTLCDGREVDSASEEWRAECEARHLLNLATRADRLAYLERVRAKRGAAGRAELERIALALHEWRRLARFQDGGDGTA